MRPVVPALKGLGPLVAPGIELAEVARLARIEVVRMAHRARAPHVASALSSVDILVALYFHALDVDPAVPAGKQVDRFVLSKGHGCSALYAALALRGFLPVEWLPTYAQNGSLLAEHPGPRGVPGIEVGTGSLGHGLAVGAGIALGRRIRRLRGRTFVLLSDGECNEGSVWEAAMFAAGRRLESLVAIVDYNKFQATGPTATITALHPLPDKWKAFGWNVVELDGHDLGELTAALASGELPAVAQEGTRLVPGQPTVVIAHTVKGRGVSFMEGDLEWHYRPPGDVDLERALAELAEVGGPAARGGRNDA